MKKSLVFLHSYASWELAVIALCVLAFLAFSGYGLGRVNTWRRRTVLFVLRAAAAGLCVFVVLQPGIETLKVTTVRDRIAVLVDSSQSMTLPAYPEKKSRFEVVTAFLSEASGLLASLAKDHDIEYYAFSAGAQLLSLGGLASVAPQGRTTDIAGALRDAARAKDQRLAGVLLFSDGDDHGEMNRAVESGPAGGRISLGSPGPVYTFCPGNQRTFKDIAVVEVKSAGFGFVKTPLEILVGVRAQGYSTRVPVLLKKEGEIIASRSLDLTPDRRDYEVRISFTPQEVGKGIYVVEVPALADEAVAGNNSLSFIVNVIRDKTRILQIAGRPSWDERFLRQLLKNDPAIDLVSFMILRTPSSIVADLRNFPIPVEDLSLIPFPVVDIFEKGLPEFDVLILQNFDYRPYAPFMYMNFVKAFVDKGGGFVMIGGDLSFSSGGYPGSPIEDVLPNTLERTATVSEGEFHPALTPAGRDHPVMRLDPDRKRNEAIWASLPGLSGFNRLLGPRPGAWALAEGPGGAPVVSVREVGKGRTLAVATDSLWRWAFSGAERHYRRFWGNAVAWLVKDPSGRRVRVASDRDTYQKGEEPVLEVKAKDPSYRALTGARVEIEVVSPSRKSVVVKAEEKEEGRYEGRINTGEAGVYLARVRVQKEGMSETSDTAFAVEGRNPELEDISLNEDLLKELAAQSGGKFFRLPARPGDIEMAFPPPEQFRSAEREKKPLWDSPWLYLPIVFLFSLEWFLRRSWDLP